LPDQWQTQEYTNKHRTDGLACPRSRVLVYPLHVILPSVGGGSEPPPYRWASIHIFHLWRRWDDIENYFDKLKLQVTF